MGLTLTLTLTLTLISKIGGWGLGLGLGLGLRLGLRGGARRSNGRHTTQHTPTLGSKSAVSTTLRMMMMYLCFCLALTGIVTTAAMAELKEEFFSTLFRNPVLDGGFATMDALLKSRGINVKGMKAHFAANHSIVSSNSVAMKATQEMLNGFLEATLYDDDTCTRPISTQYMKLNTCIPYKSGSTITHLIPNYYGPNSNQVNYTLYNDNACTDTFLEVVYPYPFHTCTNGVRLAHRDEVPPPSESLLPVLLSKYETLNSCLANNVENGFLNGYYLQKNVCLVGTGRDLFINGGDSKGQLVGTLYPSDDGSCTGNAFRGLSKLRAPLNSLCEHSESAAFHGLSGYRNFHCR